MHDTANRKLSTSSTAKYHVQSIDKSYQVYGIDAIWPNFLGMRKQYDSNIHALLLKVADHVARGLNNIISVNATPHMLMVICACERKQDEFPEDMWDEPSPL